MYKLIAYWEYHVGVIMAKKTHIKLVLFFYTWARIIIHVPIQLDLCWAKFGYIIYISSASTCDNIPRVHHKFGNETTSQRALTWYKFKSNFNKVSAHML
jgi:hypothetical protein